MRNQRVNCKELRKVTWGQLDALDPINVFKFFKQPEAVIESKDPKITDFVKQTPVLTRSSRHATPRGRCSSRSSSA